LDQLVHLVGVLAVVARRGLQLLNRDLEIGGGLLDQAVVLAYRLDRLGDVETRAEQGRPAAGCPLSKVDQGMLVLADALLDVALGERRLAGARLGGMVLEAPNRDRVEAEADALLTLLALLVGHRALSVLSRIA